MGEVVLFLDHSSSVKLEFYKEMLVDLSLWELTFNYFALFLIPWEEGFEGIVGLCRYTSQSRCKFRLLGRVFPA